MRRPCQTAGKFFFHRPPGHTLSHHDPPTLNFVRHLPWSPLPAVSSHPFHERIGPRTLARCSPSSWRCQSFLPPHLLARAASTLLSVEIKGLSVAEETTPGRVALSRGSQKTSAGQTPRVAQTACSGVQLPGVRMGQPRWWSRLTTKATAGLAASCGALVLRNSLPAGGIAVPSASGSG